MTRDWPLSGSRRLALSVSCGAAVVIAVVVFAASRNSTDDADSAALAAQARESKLRARRAANPLRYAPRNARAIGWWDGVPVQVRAGATETGPGSNIHSGDYVGPEACRKCHKKNYEDWSRHPHRWMNAMATQDNVVGDFSGTAGIELLGGRADFFIEDGAYRMATQRDDYGREYVITQTIGSRFFQYYIGKQVKGDHPEGTPSYERDHVLPFGYWIDPGEWVPVVHVFPQDDLPDGDRTDPFARDFSRAFPDYALACNHCHTTFPLADQFVRIPETVSRHAPMPMHFAVADYFAEAHPELWDATKHTSTVDKEDFLELINTIEKYDAPQHAVTQGISCEACHLGCREHAEGKLAKPSFFPLSPHLLVETGGRKIEVERNHANVNWACGRCHAGDRPQYAAGMATWNSTEYTDAMRGSCYSRLKCIDCHNPHEAIGKKWTRAPAQDDALCLKCHESLEPAAARVAHTHHPLDSVGSRCMDCHMPRLNEGLQDVVRTHAITSPTDARMIESNEPNACNICHTEQPIDWTLEYLKDWFDSSYDDNEIRTNYPNRSGPVAVGWLKSSKPHVRLIGADALTRTNSTWAMSDIVGALDDPLQINRQFARIGLEKMSGISLNESGYRFYMSPDERRQPIEKIRELLRQQVAINPDQRVEVRTENK